MGYGAGHEVKLNCRNGYAKYNGRGLTILGIDVESWDFTHPMDGMDEINPDLLKIKFNPVELSQSDRDWLKKSGIKRGDEVSFTWDKMPEGYLWSGYTRSPLNVAFPIDLTGLINIDYIGYYMKLVATVNMKNQEEFQEFIDDVLDYYPTDEDCQDYIEDECDEDMTLDDARGILFEFQNDNNRTNYGANL